MTSHNAVCACGRNGMVLTSWTSVLLRNPTCGRCTRSAAGSSSLLETASGNSTKTSSTETREITDSFLPLRTSLEASRRLPTSHFVWNAFQTLYIYDNNATVYWCPLGGRGGRAQGQCWRGGDYVHYFTFALIIHIDKQKIGRRDVWKEERN